MAEEIEMEDDLEQGEPSVELPPSIKGGSAAAILLMLLDEADAAAILKHFEPEEVRTLGKSMFDVASVSEAEIELALDRFVLGSRTISTLAVGADARIRSVMTEALGNVRADNILATIAPQSSAQALELLRWMEAPAISRILMREHRQVGAIIVAVLTPAAAAEVLEGLDEAMQADLVCRAARLTSVQRDAIDDLEAILASATVTTGKKPGVRMGGKAEVAKIVNKMPKPAMQKMLRSIKKKDRVLAQAIEEEMFVFDNLNDLDVKSLGIVLRAVDANALALALKGADPALADKFLGTMSARAAETIRDEMAEMTMVKRVDVEEAQKAIITVTRQLAEDGSIMLGGQSDDYV